MVPSARIELATHGFSVRCSTTELTRHILAFKALLLYGKKILCKFFCKKTLFLYNEGQYFMINKKKWKYKYVLENRVSQDLVNIF